MGSLLSYQEFARHYGVKVLGRDMQGNRILSELKNLKKIIGTESGFQALSLNTALERLLLFE
jgi:hypothetical protein